MAAESGVQQQLHVLYRDHHSWLFSWLRKRMGCAHHAADVAQDTFERLLASRDALLGQRLQIQEPRAYLTTTAKRLLVDRARREQIERAYLAELELAAPQASLYPSPEQFLIALQALTQICEVLEGVSSKARAAFLLHYLEEQTHAAVAAHLGVSTKMVQKYLVQVLLHCNRLLA
ncbi:sigma-70 family RNA polymerase sigma factor [Bordetella genomosp. 12]|uniref:sigma-70 family RNA polymerase sigma factor n=1 Tax=Bordetella genomosp. 12 TaxID=463035 RepID=UPI001FC9660C|nr:sigma-70 family RNA polymerase sigma factor [Bordetella genomosp. 12]